MPLDPFWGSHAAFGESFAEHCPAFGPGRDAESVKEVPWNGLSLHIPCHTLARLHGAVPGETRPCSGLKGAGFGNKQSWHWDSCECCQDTDTEFGS